MSEREMREALRQICDNLDLEARARAKQRGQKLVYPLMLGAGLLVAGCDDDPGGNDVYGAPSGTPTATQTGSGTGTTTGTATGGTGGTSAAGGGGQGGEATGGNGGGGGAAAGGGGGAAAGGDGGGPQMDYMAPDP